MGPAGLHVASDESYLAMLGSVLAPLFLPLGFGTWQAASSLVVGIFSERISGLIYANYLWGGSGDFNVIYTTSSL